MNTILVSSLPLWEPILAFAAALGLLRHHHSRSAFWLGTYGFIVLFFKDPSQAGMTAAMSHPLALAHIAVSWGAKIACLASICLSFDGPAIRRSASLRRGSRRYRVPTEYLSAPDTRRLLDAVLKLTVIYQAISIILGMFWAFDDPAWGALWQWDFIEITALLTWIGAAIWHLTQSRHCALFLFTVFLCQSLMLCGITDITQISRHAYASTDTAEIWGIILCTWAACLCLWGVRRQQSASSKAAFVPQKPQAKRHLLLLIYPAFIIAIVISGLLPERASSQWVSLDTTGNYRLEGVRAYSAGTCVHYDISLAADGTSLNLPMQACPDASAPLAHADVWVNFSKMRIWALQYRADQGIELLIRPITSNVFMQGILILICLAMFWLLSIQQSMSLNSLSGSSFVVFVPKPFVRRQRIP